MPEETPTGLPDWVKPGAVVGWTIWTGETATATITFVERFRVSTDKAVYWEATFARSLAESFLATRDIHEVKAA